MRVNFKNIYKLFTIILFLMLFIFPKMEVKADLYDDCNQLTIDEQNYILDKIDSYESDHKYNVLVRFYRQNGNIDSQIDYWYSSIYNSLEYKDSIIFAINMETRETLIIGYDGLSYVNFYDESQIVLDTSNYLKVEDYKGCIDYFLEELSANITSQKMIKTLLIVVINLVVANLIMFLCTRTYGQKDTTSLKTYISNNSRITGRRNIFIRKTVSKTRKSSSSSGGGGHSHGSGGHGHF